MSKEELRLVLSNPQTVGVIIKEAAELEFHVELTLAVYFSARSRLEEFLFTISERLSFYDKIDMLKQLRLGRELDSHKNSVRTLHCVRKIRNLVAHASYITDNQVHRLHSDALVKQMMADFPKSFRREAGYTKNRLTQLMRSNDFRNPSLQHGKPAV